MAHSPTTQPLFIAGASFVLVGVGTAVADTVDSLATGFVVFLRTTFNLQAALPAEETGAILFGSFGFFLMVLSLYISAG